MAKKYIKNWIILSIVMVLMIGLTGGIVFSKSKDNIISDSKIEKYISQLKHKDLEKRLESAKRLGELKVKYAVNLLLEALQTDYNDYRMDVYVKKIKKENIKYITRVCNIYVKSLLKICDGKIPLCEFFKNEEYKKWNFYEKGREITIYNTTFLASGFSKNKDLFDTLAEVLKNCDNGWLRSSAAGALGILGDKRAISLLEKALSDPFVFEAGDIIDYPVSSSAAGALIRLGINKDEVKAWVRAIRDAERDKALEEERKMREEKKK